MTIQLPQFPDSNLLTHSATKCWNSCRRRFYFAYILGVRRYHASEPLRLGNMWHLGVGLYESGMSIAESVETVRQCYADQNRPPYYTDEEYQVEEEKVVAMILAHHDRYKDDAILESVAVELPFNLPITNPDTDAPTQSFRNAGKIDRIARLPDETTAIVERKTTAESLDPAGDYWKALRNDAQISRYLIASRKLGFDTTKVVYDVVKKPGIKLKDVVKKEQALANHQRHYYGLPLESPCPDRETPKMYGARLLWDMKTRPDFYFARNEIARLDSDLTEFGYDLWQTQQEIRQAMNNGRFYRNPSACLEPFTCEYIDVCSELYANPEQIPEGFRRVTKLHEELETKEEVSHDHRTEPASA